MTKLEENIANINNIVEQLMIVLKIDEDEAIGSLRRVE